MGSAYAVWTGIGAAGTFLVGGVFLWRPQSLAALDGTGSDRRRGGLSEAGLMPLQPRTAYPSQIIVDGRARVVP